MKRADGMELNVQFSGTLYPPFKVDEFVQVYIFESRCRRLNCLPALFVYICPRTSEGLEGSGSCRKRFKKCNVL